VHSLPHCAPSHHPLSNPIQLDPAGGDARADVRVQADEAGTPGAPAQAGGEVQGGHGGAQDGPGQGVRHAAAQFYKGPRAA